MEGRRARPPQKWRGWSGLGGADKEAVPLYQSLWTCALAQSAAREKVAPEHWGVPTGPLIVALESDKSPLWVPDEHPPGGESFLGGPSCPSYPLGTEEQVCSSAAVVVGVVSPAAWSELQPLSLSYASAPRFGCVCRGRRWRFLCLWSARPHPAPCPRRSDSCALVEV